MLNIIQEIERYMQDFIEKKHPAFNNMPVCPFAGKARKKKRIDYRVGPFLWEDIDKIVEQARSANHDKFEIIMFVHPDKSFSFEELGKIINEVSMRLNPEFSVFGGHPLDPFMMHGVYTRRDPYPNFQIVSTPFLNKATNKLKKTDYYKE